MPASFDGTNHGLDKTPVFTRYGRFGKEKLPDEFRNRAKDVELNLPSGGIAHSYRP